MPYKLIAAINHIVFDFPGLEVAFENSRFTIRLGQNESLIDSDWSTAIGSINYNTLISCPIVYSFFPEADSLNGEAEAFMGHITDILGCLWYLKDNAVYLIYGTGFDDIAMKCCGLTLGANLTYADRKFRSESFTVKEINRAIELHYWFAGFVTDSSKNFESRSKDFANVLSITSAPSHRPYNQNRLVRAHTLISLARKGINLPMKITFYVMVLECLFTTDGTEVNYKVRERAALYLANEKDERLSIFEIVGDCYKVRSKYTHGQALDKRFLNQDKLASLSVALDGIVRRVMNKVIQNDSEVFSKENDSLNDFLQNLIFS